MPVRHHDLNVACLPSSSEGALFHGLAKESGVDQEGGPFFLGEGLGFDYGVIDQHFDAKASPWATHPCSDSRIGARIRIRLRH